MTVGVVGAGITGLAVTHYLAERDVDVVTFEADSEPGGVVRSDRVDGRVLEYGPQRIRLTPAAESLVDDLDLRGELLEADDDLPLYVYADGKLRRVPLSVSTFLRTDLLSWRGKLRVLGEPLTASARPDERAAELFERKFGAEAYRNMIEPLFGGIYASDPAEMPVEHSLRRLVALEEKRGSLLRAAIGRLAGDDTAPPPVSFEDGLQTLPEALYERHKYYVHLGAPVEAVRAADDRDGEGADEDESDGGGYVVDANGRSIEVDRLVVTTPAPAAASLLKDVPGARVEPLRELRYNSLVLVHLRADADARGLGYQVRRDEPLRTRGVTWNDSLFDRDGVYTAFLGGMSDPDAVDRSEDELAETARREFRAVMGVDAEVLDVTKLPNVLPAHDTSWAALDDVDLPDGIELATNYTSRMGVPSRLRAAERIADRIAAEGSSRITAEDPTRIAAKD